MRKSASWLAAVAGMCLWAGLAMADSTGDILQLKDNHPTTYVVKKGDTLWDISAKFLESPWLWPRIWQHNPDIDNPHLIYPGDRLTLIFVNGEPRLVRKPVIRLSPKARQEPKGEPIPTLPLHLLTPMIEHEQVLTEAMLQDSGHIVGNNQSTLMVSRGDTVFVRGGLDRPLGTELAIYRRGEQLVDPETGQVVGWRAMLVGSGILRSEQELSEMLVTDSRREVRSGDLVLPYGEQNLMPAYLQPQLPETGFQGQIIASTDGLDKLGQYQVAVLNRGIRDGVKPGQVMGIYQSGVRVLDSQQPKYSEDARWTEKAASWFSKAETVSLPEQHAGELMVFKVYDELSLAMVTRAELAVAVGDQVAQPLR